MSKEFEIEDVPTGELNALVENIMRQTGELDPKEAIRLVKSGEWVVSKLTRSWREEDGVVYFSVTSDGTTGEDWITRLESKYFHIGEYTKQVLLSPRFVPTNGVTTEVAVFKGMLFDDNDRTTDKIRAYAAGASFRISKKRRRKFGKPNAEVVRSLVRSSKRWGYGTS